MGLKSGDGPTTSDVVRQLWRELCWPFLIAVLWTAFVIWSNRELTASKLTALAVASFVSCFFFVGYGFGQYFRVSKQTRTERGLGKILARLETVVAGLEKVASSVDQTANTLHANISGGESFAVAKLTAFNSIQAAVGDCQNTVRFCFVHNGQYAIPESTFKLRDVNKYLTAVGEKTVPAAEQAAEWLEDIGFIGVGTVLTPSRNYVLSNPRFHLFLITGFLRSGITTQVLAAHCVGGKWTQAIRVWRNKQLIHELVDDEFPRLENGVPDWRLELLHFCK